MASSSLIIISLIVITLVDHAQEIPDMAQKRSKEIYNQHLLTFEGERASFKYVSPYRQDQHNLTAVLLRSTDDGYMCVINSSDPAQVCRSDQTDRVEVDLREFILRNVLPSDSGEYVTERRVMGKLRETRLYNLVVCQSKLPISKTSKAKCIAILESQENRLQVYKEEFIGLQSDDLYHATLVLDTRLPVEGVIYGQGGEVEILSNTTTVCIHTRRPYTLVLWRGGQCGIGVMGYGCSMYVPGLRLGSMKRVPHFLKPSERFTLSCLGLTEHAEQVKWKTPSKVLSLDAPPSLNIPTEEEKNEDMYIETRNYSLIIPSVEVKHTGKYDCMPDYKNRGTDYFRHEVFVCSDLEVSTVLFSVGDTAALVCGAELNVTEATCSFYRHVGAELEHLTLDPKQMEAIKDESMGRGTMSNSQFSLTMSNLTSNDSGLYYCRVWGYAEDYTLFCFDKKIHLLLKNPFGIHSTFYRVYSVLMACGLLGMICAVMSVHLKIRGREQHSQETQGRTAEQPGLPMRKRKARGGRSASDGVSTAEDRVLE